MSKKKKLKTADKIALASFLFGVLQWILNLITELIRK